LSKNINTHDYYYISAFIWGHESKLLNKERVDRMLEAKSFDDMAKILEECGYGDLSEVTAGELEGKLAERRAQIMRDLSAVAPDSDIVSIFRIKYDYHNAKVLIKAQARGVDGSKLMSDAGRISPKALNTAFIQDEYLPIPGMLADAMRDAKETLARTGDPQLADFILDKAYYKEFIAFAASSGSQFLLDYGRLSVDSANLRAAVRSMRMNKDSSFLQQVLADGGNVGIDRIVNAVMSKASLATLYTGSPLHKAAVEGAAAVTCGRLTDFEKLCDNALASFPAAARMASVGEKVLIGYICSIENELSAVRIIMTGRFAGLPASAIRERLRDNYV
jgi:V/A-type H+-transporting ATPase subunit C